mgnify:CR=1 FL=1
MNTIFRKLFKKKTRMLWYKVPMYCNSRGEKDILIADIINQLEHKIKIK